MMGSRALLAAALLVHALMGAWAVESSLGTATSGSCSNLVSNTGLQSSSRTEVLCGADWLLKLLQEYNATVVGKFLQETDGNLVRVLDAACALPGTGEPSTCEHCVEAFASFFEMASDSCSAFSFKDQMAQDKWSSAAKSVGTECYVTNNPWQVFHPNTLITSPCYLCARAFLNQQACQNTVCNDEFGLSWWPFYPLPPNSGADDDDDDDAGLGLAAASARWSTETVCDCFSAEFVTPLSGDDLDRFGYCLWVVYQGTLPQGLVAASDAAAASGGGGDGDDTK